MQRTKAKRKTVKKSPSCVEKKPRQNTHHWKKSSHPVAAIFSNPPRQAVVRGSCWNWKLGCFTEKSTNRADVWWDWRGATPSKVTHAAWIFFGFIRQLHPNSHDAKREKGNIGGKKGYDDFGTQSSSGTPESSSNLCTLLCTLSKAGKGSILQTSKSSCWQSKGQDFTSETCTMVLAPPEANHPCPV